MRKVRLGLVVLLVSMAISTAALAQGLASSPALPRPTIAQPAPWVQPVPIPAAPTQAGEAGKVILLVDNQAQLTAEGDTTYHASAYKIAAASGLDETALQIRWDPSLETLTLHHYRILRDEKVIDLLGDGSALTVVRRETRMEMAALDGELTAAMQPEDLRVGDVIDLAYSVTRRDPAMGGRSETMLGPDDGVPYGRYHLRVIWPANKTIRWHAYPGIVAPREVRTAGGSELIADLVDVVTPRPPQGAPVRFRLINAVQLSEFPTWASVSAALAPLYSKAETLSVESEVKGLAKSIAASTPDPEARTAQALRLVQEQVRYLYLGMDDGGYVPAAAETTWSRRFGDCKGKAVLLVALLNALGIDAKPVLVNTQRGDLVAAQKIPMVSAFDHVIVQATINGRTYWLDGTRLGDTNLALLEIPRYGAGLPIVAGGTDLVPFAPAVYTQPNSIISLALDATDGIALPAPAVAVARFHGELATDVRVQYSGLSTTALDRQLREYWRGVYDFITPSEVKTEEDAKTGDFILKMTGLANMDWFEEVGTRWYEADRARVGWKFNIDREGQLNPDAPFAFEFPEYWENRETIQLPNNGDGFRLQGESLDKTIDGLYSFKRTVSLDKGVLTVVASTQALGGELPAARAEQVRKDMQALSNKGVFIRAPANYIQTDKEISALSNDKKAQANAYLLRGAHRLDKGQVDASLADEDAALAIDPNLAAAYAVRGLALATKGDAKADADADRALALDAKQAGAWRAKGLLARNASRYADAETAYSNEMALNPKDPTLFSDRGWARLSQNKCADALADFDAALAIAPDMPLNVARAIALQCLGRPDEALAEVDRAVAKTPTATSPLSYRSELRQRRGDRKGAIEDLSAVISLNPKPEYYLRRASLLASTDLAQANADIAAALKLEPKNVQALAQRASFATQARHFAEAETDINTLIELKTDQWIINQLKIEWLVAQGKLPEALRLADTEVVAKRPSEAAALNQRCWLKATRNIALDTALADCDAAVKLAPQSPAILDSRAFTNLKLGNIEKAIADYDAALAIEPNMAASLFGRALARAKHGDRDLALADLAKARKLAPDIDDRFKEYGMVVPDDPAFHAPK